MSLLSNQNITRYGIVYSWNNNWVESNILYTSIIYSDIYINEFINGIYYKLKMPASLPIIKSIGYNKTTIYLKSFIFYRKKWYNKWKQFLQIANKLKYISRRISMFINLILKYVRVKNNFVNYSNQFIYSYCIKNTNYIYNNNNILRGTNTKYYKFNKYYIKFFSKKFNVQSNNYIEEYNNKNKTKNITFNLIKNNNNVNKTNIKTSIIQLIKKKLNNTSFKQRIIPINKKILSNNINNKLFVKYVNIINKHTLYHKYTINKYNDFKFYRTAKNNRYVKKSNIYIKKNLLNNIMLSNNNLHLLYNFLLYKLSLYINFIISYKIKYCIYNLRHVSVIRLVKKIIKHTKLIQNIKNVNLYVNSKFNNLICYNSKINVIKFDTRYNRLRDFYRKKQLIKRYNKSLKQNRFIQESFIVPCINIFYNESRYIRSVNRKLYNNQLGLRINDTLNEYLSDSIYFIQYSKKRLLNNIDNPKLISDYIKILMKYEYKTPFILKDVVKHHSIQQLKSKKLMYLYIKKIDKSINSIFKKISVLNNKITKIYKYISNKKYTKTVSKNIGKKDIKYNTLNKDKFFYRQLKYNRKNNILLKKKMIYLNINKTNIKKNISICNKVYSNNKYTNVVYNNNSENNGLIGNLEKWLYLLINTTFKKYPLIGMRIELSGPSKKGRRTQTHLYSEWVDSYTLPGRMPLVTIMNDIEYWQSYGLTQRAAIGIKVWMHFHTLRYSALRKKELNSKW